MIRVKVDREVEQKLLQKRCADVISRLVRLANDLILILEIKGMETEQDRAKHQTARRWVVAVNNWGKLGQWDFHVNKEPQLLFHEMRWYLEKGEER